MAVANDSRSAWLGRVADADRARGVLVCARVHVRVCARVRVCLYCSSNAMFQAVSASKASEENQAKLRGMVPHLEEGDMYIYIYIYMRFASSSRGSQIRTIKSPCKSLHKSLDGCVHEQCVTGRGSRVGTPKTRKSPKSDDVLPNAIHKNESQFRAVRSVSFQHPNPKTCFSGSAHAGILRMLSMNRFSYRLLTK